MSMCNLKAYSDNPTQNYHPSAVALDYKEGSSIFSSHCFFDFMARKFTVLFESRRSLQPHLQLQLFLKK